MKKIDGRYLRKMREKHGYSLREFAELVYSSKSSVQRWEKSFAPDDEEILKRIAEIYETSIEEMIAQSEKEFGNDKKKPTTEQLIQAKYGTWWLAVALVMLFALGILLLIL